MDDAAARTLGIELAFRGEGVGEQGVVTSIARDDASAITVGDVIVEVDPRYFRPAEVETLLGDPSKGRREMGWEPEVGLMGLIEEMVHADLQRARRRALLQQNGFK